MAIKVSEIGVRYFDLQEYPQELQDKYQGCGWCWLHIVDDELVDWGYAKEELKDTTEDDGVDEDLWIELCGFYHEGMVAGMASCWQLCILE